MCILRFTIAFMVLFSGSIFAVEQSNAYIFSYFTGNGEDGLHLAYSYDGYTWEALNEGNSFLTPQVGGKLMRDPCIIQTSDGIFHMVWTVDWWMTSIGYAHSRDLIHWSKQQHIPVMENEEGAKNSWAPELYYDEASAQFLICWATTIPGRFPETENKGDNNHRMYYKTTKDFRTFSISKLLYNDGFNVIDSTITKKGNTYFMFLKDETLTPPAKNIRIATAQNVEGPWGKASEPITGDYWAEGPTVIKLEDRWIVYFDQYRNHQYGAVQSGDLEHWEDISDKISFPKGVRHGTILQVSSDVLDELLKHRMIKKR